jgi:hypothetical protein
MGRRKRTEIAPDQNTDRGFQPKRRVPTVSTQRVFLVACYALAWMASRLTVRISWAGKGSGRRVAPCFVSVTRFRSSGTGTRLGGREPVFDVLELVKFQQRYGYRLMLKQQREGDAMSDPVRLEAGVQMLAEACPGQSARTWDLFRTVLDEGFESIDRTVRTRPSATTLSEVRNELAVVADVMFQTQRPSAIFGRLNTPARSLLRSPPEYPRPERPTPTCAGRHKRRGTSSAGVA